MSARYDARRRGRGGISRRALVVGFVSAAAVTAAGFALTVGGGSLASLARSLPGAAEEPGRGTVGIASAKVRKWASPWVVVLEGIGSHGLLGLSGFQRGDAEVERGTAECRRRWPAGTRLWAVSERAPVEAAGGIWLFDADPAGKVADAGFARGHLVNLAVLDSRLADFVWADLDNTTVQMRQMSARATVARKGEENGKWTST